MSAPDPQPINIALPDAQRVSVLLQMPPKPSAC
jgi:hypothetical protein